MSDRSARGPRRIGGALRRLSSQLEPATPLARVQAGWEAAAGVEFAARCRPVAERDGTIVVVCESAVWAQELEFRGPEVVARLQSETGLDDVSGLTVQIGDPDGRT